MIYTPAVDGEGDGGAAAEQARFSVPPVRLWLASRARSVEPRAAVSSAVALVLLVWPALWNGYPLVFADTGTYVHSSFGLRVPFDRPAFYGVFLILTHWGLSLWLVVLAQSAILVALLRILLRRELPQASQTARDLALVGVAMLLAVGTALPWFSAQIMPDVFTGAGVVTVYLLARFPDEDRVQTYFLRAVFVTFLLVHLSHVPLGVGLLCAAALVSWATPRVHFGGNFRAAWICVAIGLVVPPVFHLVRTGDVFYSRASHAFLLGRFVENGFIEKLLEERCPEVDYALCPYRDQLGRDAVAFVWDPSSPLQAIGGMEGSATEANRMIRDSLQSHPAEHVVTAFQNTGRQMFTKDLGDGLAAHTEETWVVQTLARRFPWENGLHAASRQQSGALWRDTRAFVGFQRSLWLGAALASLGGLALFASGRAVPAVELHVFGWLAVLANAAIVSNLSATVDRYQARISWLIPLAVAVTVLAAIERRRDSSPR